MVTAILSGGPFCGTLMGVSPNTVSIRVPPRLGGFYERCEVQPVAGGEIRFTWQEGLWEDRYAADIRPLGYPARRG